MGTIPVIDFSLFTSDPKECARQIGEASKDIGFFYIKNHGVCQDLIDRLFSCSKRFFQQPLESKNRYLMKDLVHGYSPINAETLDLENQRQGDLKETFDIMKHTMNEESTKYFVQGDVAEQEKVVNFYKTLHRLANNILQCFAIALEIPESAGGRYFFDNSHQLESPCLTDLRFLHYPPQSCDPETPLCGSHTDYGSVSLLIQKDVGGLEVQASRTHKDVPWIPVPVIPNAILVNIGDHLQMWTNGLLKSTKHRVTYDPQQHYRPRYSTGFFLFANADTKLDPIPSPLITQEMRAEAVEFEEGRNMTAGEYVAWRIKRTYA
ncbi:hypothetical protein BCR41DRAFT_347981 [Lobosporangium transversale]|uniref:Fe2OG dioxygenase domain-containing protein n=1 Tax=Lobosporangium transversale TaxID=64571 RepID=A0A1Y2GXN5_9FUNG|nr:hypothetical protein BCR41DRAFT_347981 [Lobosporangium transversale]ORZ26243.1 hypothetical protein BCR41DRAFT_347981 [Lobosporangium transversale]|eukprot:XP_021884008.1 hypothetical protein BCR41DRAFT_347981 [Lobosporangium transversale]